MVPLERTKPCGRKRPPHFYPSLCSSHSGQLVMHSLPPTNPQPHRSKKKNPNAWLLLSQVRFSQKKRLTLSKRFTTKRFAEYWHGNSQKCAVTSICTVKDSWNRLNTNKERGGKTTGNMVLTYTPVIGGSVACLGQ